MRNSKSRHELGVHNFLLLYYSMRYLLITLGLLSISFSQIEYVFSDNIQITDSSNDQKCGALALPN